jgi:hypothetical protein
MVNDDTGARSGSDRRDEAHGKSLIATERNQAMIVAYQK